jgi:hypothetical protein
METDMEGGPNNAANNGEQPNLNEDRFSGVVETDSSIRNSIVVIDDSKESEML